MLNSDAAIAADLPNGDSYTTEVGDLLFSLQALLIREADGGRVDVSFAETAPAEQPRWSLDELPAPAPEIVAAAATADVAAELEIVAEPEIFPEPEIALDPGSEIIPEPEIALDPEPVQVAEIAPLAEASFPSPSWIAEPEPQPVLFDHATGAPTLDAMQQEIDRYGSRVSASLVALDVTPIADIRAQHGDAIADSILRAIVEAVPFALRAEDQVFRTGTDELTLCVPGADLSDAAVMGLRLQMAVKDVLVRRELPAVILSIRPYQQVAA